jgi:hypothetical protein
MLHLISNNVSLEVGKSVCVCKVHKRVKIYCHRFLDIQWAIINSSNICNNNSLEVSGNVCVFVKCTKEWKLTTIRVLAFNSPLLTDLTTYATIILWRWAGVCVFVKYIKDRKSTDYNHMSVTFNNGKGFTHPEFEHK